MHINDVNVLELLETHPEIQKLRDITANHGEENDITRLCEVIAHLFAKIDALTDKTKSNVTIKREK